MSELVSLDHQDDIAVIWVDNPPVNALSPGVPESIARLAGEAASDEGIRAIVLIGKGRTFIAGADIREFAKVRAGKKERGEGLHPMLFQIEDCAKPVVAAIHGTALGGGLETAMACHYRVAIASAQVGQPEIKLGILPGAGGTLRLPRLAGVAKAVEMCALGEPISARDALDHGIIDGIADEDTPAALLAFAIAFAREAAHRDGPPPKVRERDEKLGDEPSNAMIFAAIREKVRKKRRGEMAPLKTIESVEAATTMSFEDARRKTAELFMECLRSPQSEGLVHVFFSERRVRKIPDIPKDTPTRNIGRAAVVGAGTMGAGIAMALANAGIPVLLKDSAAEALRKAGGRIRASYDRSVARGRYSAEFADQRVSMIQATQTYDGFEEADLVVEAVFEDLDLKKNVFRELDKVTKADVILATNTSTLDIDAIAAVTADWSRVIGAHFFSPAHVMRLLEVVRGSETAKDVIATLMALARRLGKVGVVVGNCHGFVGNRMFLPYMREAHFLAEEGAGIAEIDQALEDFGMAMGPLAVNDLAGIDTGWRIHQQARHLEPEGARQPLVEDCLYEMGRYGQKTGAGWYRYGQNRRREEDPEIQARVRELAREAGVPQRSITADEIVERTIYALINEGARILEEGIALRAADIDMIFVSGYGFPGYRGGPMWYADTVGLEVVHRRVVEFKERHGYWRRPAPLLEQLAREGGTFEEWDEERAEAGGS